MRKHLIALLLPIAMFSALLPQPSAAQGLRTPEVGISATSGDVAAATATATLPGTQNRVTSLCGFTVTGTGATATSVVTITIGNLNATTTFDLVVPAGATVILPLTQYSFYPCLPSSAPNQSVTVSVPTLGAGNAHSQVTAWGMQTAP